MAALLIVFLGGGGYYLYESFRFTESIEEFGDLFRETPSYEEEELLLPLPVDEKVVIVPEAEESLPKNNAPPPFPDGAIHADFEGGWRVQIGVCSYRECLESFQAKITSLGYLENDMITERSTVNSKFFSLFLVPYYDAKEAKAVVKAINRKNTLGLKAYSAVNAREQTRVFVGKIPGNQGAKEKVEKIRKHLADLFATSFPGEEMKMHFVVENQNLRRTTLSVGPYASKGKAQTVRQRLRKSDYFRDALVKKN